MFSDEYNDEYTEFPVFDCFSDIESDEDVIAPFPQNQKLAHAYVPYQESNKTFPINEALKRGTIYPALDQPYIWKANILCAGVERCSCDE